MSGSTIRRRSVLGTGGAAGPGRCSALRGLGSPVLTALAGCLLMIILTAAIGLGRSRADTTDTEPHVLDTTAPVGTSTTVSTPMANDGEPGVSSESAPADASESLLDSDSSPSQPADPAEVDTSTDGGEGESTGVDAGGDTAAVAGEGFEAPDEPVLVAGGDVGLDSGEVGSEQVEATDEPADEASAVPVSAAPSEGQAVSDDLDTTARLLLPSIWMPWAQSSRPAMSQRRITMATSNCSPPSSCRRLLPRRRLLRRRPLHEAPEDGLHHQGRCRSRQRSSPAARYESFRPTRRRRRSRWPKPWQLLCRRSNRTPQQSGPSRATPPRRLRIAEGASDRCDWARAGHDLADGRCDRDGGARCRSGSRPSRRLASPGSWVRRRRQRSKPRSA